MWDEGPFWEENTLGFQFIWPKYDDEFFKVSIRPPTGLALSSLKKKTINIKRVGIFSQEHGDYLRGIYGFEKVNGRKNVLVGWIGGDDAAVMENVSDEQLLCGCYNLLKRSVRERKRAMEDVE